MGITRDCYVGTNKSQVTGKPWYSVSSGNSSKHFINNKTYNVKTDEILVELLGYNSPQGRVGSAVTGATGLDAAEDYEIHGNPFKFNYDTQQLYSDCGIDSSLNILATAGLINVKEKLDGTEYKQYLETPTGKKKNSETGEITYTYPKSIKIQDESERKLVKYAIDNNYAEAYMDRKYYNTTDDIYSIDGGTFFVNGAESWGEALGSIAGLVESYSKGSITMSHISLNVEILKEDDASDTSDSSGTSDSSDSSDTEEVVANLDKYKFAQNIMDVIDEGKGVIIGGNAYVLTDSTDYVGYGGHAISIVGYVSGPTKDGEGNYVKSDTYDTYNDIQGFYVVDTGGWLDDTDAGVSYLTVEKLYDFLTVKSVNGDKKYRYGNVGDIVNLGSEILVTDQNIKFWSDAMNINGNRQHNILIGTANKNTMHGKASGDELLGMSGNDKLYGDSDNDTIYGGSGRDTLYGGSGNDTYKFVAKSGYYDIMEYGSYWLNTDNKDEYSGTYSANNDTISLGSGKDKIIINGSDGDLQYSKNKTGDLVIRYNSHIDGTYYKDADGDWHVDSVSDGASFENTILVDDYFKKSLYYNLKNVTLNSVTNTTYRDIIKEEYPTLESLRENYYYTVTDAEWADIISGKTYDEVLDSTFDEDFLNEIIDTDITLSKTIDLYNSFKLGDIKLENELYMDRANKYTATAFDDSIIGGYKNDTINGASGCDTIMAGRGRDVVKGGNGNDSIYASYGNDKIYGDAGENTIRYDANTSGFSGHDTIYSGKGKDTVVLYNVDDPDNDVRWARNGNDLVIIYNTETGNSFTVANYFKANTSSIDSIIFDGEDHGYSLYGFMNRFTEDVDKTFLNKTEKWTAGTSTEITADGKGDDKFYNYSTYKYTNKSAGSDVIYTSGTGINTIDFSSTDLVFDATGVDGCISNIGEYGYTKSGNDLIINYANTEEYTDNRNITISNYFKSKASFVIKSSDSSTLDLKNATIAFSGIEDKSNKITGTSQNDYIVGKNYKDTLKGGAGDDTIIGGKGNDNITGGTGKNVLEYTSGDGSDTINLSKGENLTINMKDYASSDLSYKVSKGNLIISYVDKYGTATKLLTLKGYGKSDVTKGGNVSLSLSDSTTIDLPTADLGFKYSSFSAKKYKYSGKWLSETVDARGLNSKTGKSDRGVKIYGNAGNDTIWGSKYNDTINGGAGDDVIISNSGTNSVQGGSGDDTYYILYGKATYGVSEKTTISDTSGDDVVYSCLKYDTLADEYNLWVNMSKGSDVFSITLSKKDNTANQIKISGVETFGCIDLKDEDSPLSSGVEKYTFNIDQLKNDIAGWFTTNTDYSSTADVYGAKNDAAGSACSSLQAIFNNALKNGEDGKGNYWQTV